MNLLYIHQYFTFPENSGGTRSYDLSKQLIEKNIDVTIITTSAKLANYTFTKKWTYIEREKIKLWVLKLDYNNKLSYLNRIVSFLKFMILSTIKITQIKTDIIIATSTPLSVAFPAIWKNIISKTPFIFEVRDVWPEIPIQLGIINNSIIVSILRKLEKYIYRKANSIVVLSDGMKNNILSRINLNKISVIPNISEINRFKDISNIPNIDFNFEGRKIILYAGTIGYVNDIMFVARLAKDMIDIDSKIAFLIVGDGKEREEIKEYCIQAKLLDKNIFFINSINKNQLPYLYSKATIASSFVRDCSVLWDNSANKFFDTLAASKPILINYQGWQKEVIETNNCGYYIPYNYILRDVMSLANYINDDDLIRVQCENSSKVAIEYSIQNASNKYIDIIKSII